MQDVSPSHSLERARASSDVSDSKSSFTFRPSTNRVSEWESPVQATPTEGRAKTSPTLPEEKINEYMEYLNLVPLLKRLLNVEKRKVAGSMREMEYIQDQVIIQEGDLGDDLYVLCEGSVKIMQNGTELQRVDASIQNSTIPVFGEGAVFKNRLRNATVVVATPTAKVLALDRESFNQHLGPIEYFSGNEEEESASSDSDDEPRECLEPELPEDDAAERQRVGDPFMLPALHAAPSPVARESKNSDGFVASKLLDDKLWALGMSHEQLAKSTLERQQQRHHRLSTWPSWRVFLHTISCSLTFKFISLAFIVLNISALAITLSNRPGEARVAESLSQICKVAFAVEMLIRLLSYAKGIWSGWLFLDVILLVLVLVEAAMRSADHVGGYLYLLAALQAVRIVRVLRMLRFVLTPLRVILQVLSSGLQHVASAGIFVGLIWLMASICFTSLLGGRWLQDDETVYRAQEHFSSIRRSLLTAIEITAGGLCWGGAIFDPLMSSRNISWRVGGIAVLTLVIVSSLLVWNLVLGIYVRQVVMITKEVKQGEEQEALHDGERGVERMREKLDSIDTDRDGQISTKEMKACLQEDSGFASTFQLGPEELSILHAALDAEGEGTVSISDFLFGVLKLTGASKTLDMLSIDYRQKMLLKSMAALDQSSKSQFESLHQDLDALCAYASFLDKRINALHTGVKKAKGDLLAEIERLGRIAEHARRQAAQNQLLVDAQRKQANLEVRAKIEAQLELMQSELNKLTQARQLNALSSNSSNPTAAIRKAVRERLDAELGPWLDRELAKVQAAR